MPRRGDYIAIIESLFFNHYEEGVGTFEFVRDEIAEVAARLGIAAPSNVGDVIYAFRHRNARPESVLATQPEGFEWSIEGAGIGKYRFRLGVPAVIPRSDILPVDIPDATPELIRAYTLNDEQALLAVVRYNRLMDIFLGLATYSLQNHLRTHVPHVGQIEIDELYIGIDKRGRHYIIPVQAKGSKDRIGSVQSKQDMQYAGHRFPGMRCRAVAAQFLDDGVVALIELAMSGDEIKVVEERHYRLIPAEDLDRDAIHDYDD